MSATYPIPARLNLALAALSIGGCLGLLVWASTVQRIWLLLPVAGLFAMIGNTVFALLHEAVHRILHPNPWVNEAVGMLLAAMFPTSLVFQRACHLGHHRRNRTDSELFDQYRPEDNRFLKSIQWYGIFTGFYWPVVPLGCGLVALLPWLPRLFSHSKLKPPGQTGLMPFLAGAAGVSTLRLQAETLFALALHGALIGFGLVTLKAWLLCYLTYGWVWGSLQYADHAFSVRNIREGAWNLRVIPLTQWIFLNYHLHLNHHRKPDLPWIHLPGFLRLEDPYPSFWDIYFRMWRGPRPATSMSSLQPDPALEQILKAQG